MSRIFITGIDGVLGSTLATKLRTQGHKVFGCGLTHSADPNTIRADVSKYRQLQQGLFEFADIDGWEPKWYDVLFHFAAEFGRKNGENYYEDLWTTNCIGTQNVIEACMDRRIPMVFASSSEAYGLSEQYDNGEPLREEMLDKFPPNYHNQYALSKRTNEIQILTAARNNPKFRAIILRFFNIYGPPERFSPYRSVVCQLAWKMLNNQPITVNREGFRSHLWIGDWANTVANIASPTGTELLLKDPKKVWFGAGGTPGVPVFNIGANNYESIVGLYDRLHKLIPGYDESKMTYIETEPANSATKQPDNSLAAVYLNHRPEKSLDEGLEETVDYLCDILDAQ